MSTAVSLAAEGIDDAVADAFFARIAELEDVLSRFRDHSDVSRLARGEVGLDDVDPAVREVVARCESMRELTRGDFEHEPRRRHGDPSLPPLDVNALAKGWIIEDAAMVLRLNAEEFTVNAGGDILASRRPPGRPRWRFGVQHPEQHDALLGVFEIAEGAVATSGRYERGDHIRSPGATPATELSSVTVVGPDLADADALGTAVFAGGATEPPWWPDVDPAYGLLTVTAHGWVRWLPPVEGDVTWGT